MCESVVLWFQGFVYVDLSQALATIQCNLDSSVTIEKFSVRIGWNKFAIYEPEDSNKCALCLLDINGSISDCHIDCEFFE